LDIAFFFQAEDGIRYRNVTGVQTCALPISVVLLACLVGGSVFFHRHRHTLLSVRQSARAGDSSRPARAGSKQTFLLCQTAQTLPCPVCQTLHILLYPGGTPPPKPQYTTLFAFCLYHRRHPPGIHDRPAGAAKSG